jgi:hypothetical protein
VFLLTRPEGYPPADKADRRLRILMRIVVFFSIAAMVLLQVQLHFLFSSRNFRRDQLEMVALSVLFFTIFGFLPLLLFLRLRGLARRVRSAHLAEHCIIVGVGAFASTLYIAAVIVVVNYADKWGLGTNWTWQSPVSLIMLLVMSVASGLFILWSLYLLVRFAIAFWIAAGKLRGKWTRDDRSLTI